MIGWVGVVSETEAYCLAALRCEATESLIRLRYVWCEAAWTTSLSYTGNCFNTMWYFYFSKILKHCANTQRDFRIPQWESCRATLGDYFESNDDRDP